MNRRALAWSALALVSGAAALSISCSPSDDPSASDDANTATDSAPPVCDPSNDPSCVNDSTGVFVNGANGSDSNAGTKEAPLKTIGAALGKATGSKNNVYICAGTYAEHVKLTSAVNLVGGFACADWTYAATNKPKVAPSDVGYALDVESVSSAVTISDLEFDSVDGKNAGDSSVAAFINGSNVTFARVTVSAGTGTAGANATLDSLTFPDQAALNGNNADGGTPAAANTVACPGDAGLSTTGGAGGVSIGGNGSPGSPSLDGGAGGTIAECTGGQGGHPGTGAPVGNSGSGAKTSGSIVSLQWLPASGEPGAIGGPGQGGGGGAGISGGGGGGGGAGGCGGAGGGAGAGGGGSIAIVSNVSTITISSSKLTATNAGAGGAGAAGQVGQTPGGFHGNGAGAGCSGGNGGSGGAGGAGGGGAGGVSVGILYEGTAPTIDNATQGATTVAPSGGAKGTGGAPGMNDGVDGVAQSMLEVQ